MFLVCCKENIFWVCYLSQIFSSRLNYFYCYFKKVKWIMPSRLCSHHSVKIALVKIINDLHHAEPNRQFSLFFVSLLGHIFLLIMHSHLKCFLLLAPSTHLSPDFPPPSLTTFSYTSLEMFLCPNLDSWPVIGQTSEYFRLSPWISFFSFLSALTLLMISKSLVACNTSYILTTINFKFPAQSLWMSDIIYSTTHSVFPFRHIICSQN